MEEQFKQNQILKILPQDVNLTCSALVTDCDGKFITAKPIKSKNKIEGACECFSATDAGIIYFKTTASGTENEYKLAIPTEYNIMQRREYSRIKFNQETTLENNDKKLSVLITDLSAGGMRILSQQELTMSNLYKGTIQIGKNTEIQVNYAPMRQERNEDNSFIISGRFEELPHKDKIALIQYCFSRQMERTNK